MTEHSEDMEKLRAEFLREAKPAVERQVAFARQSLQITLDEIMEQLLAALEAILGQEAAEYIEDRLAEIGL